MTTPPTNPTTPEPRIHPERKRRVKTALTLFSVAAWVTGVMLLLLCVRMVMEYALHMDVGSLNWVAIAHGWMYALFLLATLNPVSYTHLTLPTNREV